MEIIIIIRSCKNKFINNFLFYIDYCEEKEDSYNKVTNVIFRVKLKTEGDDDDP